MSWVIKIKERHHYIQENFQKLKKQKGTQPNNNTKTKKYQINSKAIKSNSSGGLLVFLQISANQVFK